MKEIVEGDITIQAHETFSFILQDEDKLVVDHTQIPALITALQTLLKGEE